MDFVERWLGVAPDGGNGAVELAVLMACACAALAAALWRYRHVGFSARARVRVHAHLPRRSARPPSRR